MHPDEILVARLSGGVSVRRCLSVDRDHVRVSVGRNREARIPVGRVLAWTGLTARSEEEVEEFRGRCADLAAQMDLAEVWEVVRDGETPLGLDDLAGLLWTEPLDALRRVALLLCLDASDLYFAERDGAYVPRAREAVEQALAARRRQETQSREAAELAEHLARGALPADPTAYQASLLGHLRGFAVHGDDYARAAAARRLLDRLPTRTSDPQRLAFDLLVGAGVLGADEPLELERAGIEERFPDDALAEAQTLSAAAELGRSHRRDLSDLPAFTVDDAATRDRDDALSLEENADGYTVGIHIADAGAIVPASGALDREADRRMASIYLPERRIAMLPPAVSEDAGSLSPGQPRCAVSILARLSHEGEAIAWEVVPSVVCSRAAIAYDEADLAIEDVSHAWHRPLAALASLSQFLARRRHEAGAIAMRRPEMSVKVDALGVVSVVVQPRSTQARTMVAEFMILCNSLLARFCRDRGLPAAYRSQPRPDLSGLDLAPGDAEGAYDPLAEYLLVKRLPPAQMSTVPAPHAGLAVEAYLQATSPLRRYPDLVMQRQVSHYLATGAPAYAEDFMASVAARADVQLRKGGQVEEERRRYWFLKYLRQTRLGPDAPSGADVLEAVVLENQAGRGSLLELREYPYRVRAELRASDAPGQVVALRLHGVDLWRRTAQFVRVEAG